VKRTNRRLCPMFVLAGLAAMAHVATANELVLVENFEASTFESGWSILHENPSHISLTDRPGFLRIDTERGTFGTDSTVNNMVLRDYSGDFILDAKVEFDPEVASQFAGLVIYEDPLNLVALGLAYAQGDRGEFRGVVLLNVNGSTESNTQRPGAFYNSDTTDKPNEVFLRLLRYGDQFVGAYSSDGLNYTDVGVVANGLPDTISVGLVAANGDFAGCGTDCDTSIPADFDFFSITTLDQVPVLPSGGGSAGGSTLSIDGADALGAGTATDFTAVLTDAADMATDVTDSANWLVAPQGVGSMNGNTFVAANVDQVTQATIVATYGVDANGVTQQLVASRVVRIDPAPMGLHLCGVGCVGILPLTLLGLCGLRRLRK